jgi:hypothetical protein
MNNLDDNYINLLAAIYKQAVADDTKAILKHITKSLSDMSIKRRDAAAYIKINEETIAQITEKIKHNVFAESQEWGGNTRAMQAKSINSFMAICDELIKAYRMTYREKMDKVSHVQDLENNIQKLIEQKERWESLAEKATPIITGMPQVEAGENQRELAICNMVDTEKEITKAIDNLCDYKDKIRRYISITGDADQILLDLIETGE